MDKTKIAEIIRKMSDEERQELADEIEKPQSARWKPEVGELYWFMHHSGYACKGMRRNHTSDNHLFARGEVFRTKDECIANDKRMKKAVELADMLMYFAQKGELPRFEFKSTKGTKIANKLEKIANKLESKDE